MLYDREALASLEPTSPKSYPFLPRSIPVSVCLSSPGHEARVLATEPQGQVTHHALPLGKGLKELDSCATFPPTGRKRATRLFQPNDPSPPREVAGTLLPSEKGTRFLETTLGPQVSVLPGSQLELQVPGRTRSTLETELSEKARAYAPSSSSGRKTLKALLENLS